MRKFTLMFFALLLATVGAWAQTIATTQWIDYTTMFHENNSYTDKDGHVLNSDYPWGNKVVSTAPSPYTVQVTLVTVDGENHIGYGTRENYKRPWLVGGQSYKMSVPEGYKIAAYEVGTRLVNNTPGKTNTYTYTIADGGTATSGDQSTGETKKITVAGLNTQEIILDMSNVASSGNNGLFMYTLRLKLSVDNMDDVVNNTDFAEVVINVQNPGDDQPQYIENLILPVGSTITLKDFVPGFSFVTYGNETGTVQNVAKNTFTLTYTVDEEEEAKFPFATSYNALTTENKWMSMFTLNGRMHVYDADSEGNVYNITTGADGITYTVVSSTRKYPTIDKATFTRLNKGFFWGFVREGRFKPTYIVNKEAGEGQYLYLKVNGANTPLLCADETGSGLSAVTTREWIIEKGQTATENGKRVQYYGVRAVGTSCYINNFQSNGYMTTWTQGPLADGGSNIKFTPELETYEILKGRALTAPCNAVHSLDGASRKLITDIPESEQTVAKYDEVIKQINTENNGTGFIEFVDGGYYYLRNYTPATENSVYVLGSDNGTSACTFTVPSGADNNQAGTADVAMTYSNINAIWKISTKIAGEAPGTGIGASRTIARELTHVNSGKKLTNPGTRQLTDEGAKYYFVELGAGQHFMKDVQYNGSGQQAKRYPLSCQPNGTLYQKNSGAHTKNSRDTWYGIQVTELSVTLPANGGGYATIHLPFGVKMPVGLTAYAVTSTDNGVATLKGGHCIPANQGAILKGEAGKTYKLIIDDTVNEDSEVTAVWSTNKLKGSNMAEEVSNESAYVLSNPATGNGVGLYRAEETSGTWHNNANKAYLPAIEVTDASARFLSFNFDTVTGLDIISVTESGSEESVVYDLSGRRVRTAQKGMYIVNGKKVIK